MFDIIPGVKPNNTCSRCRTIYNTSPNSTQIVVLVPCEECKSKVTRIEGKQYESG